MDWNELMKDAIIDLAPPGEYDMIVDKAEGTTYSTGSTGIKAVLMFENGPHAGQKVFNNFVIPQAGSDNYAQALGFFFRNMQTLGIDSAFFAKNPQLDEVANAVIGRRIRATLTHREWNNEKQYSVKSIKPANGAPTGTVTPKTSGPSVPTMTPNVSAPVASAPSMPTAPKVPSVAPPVPPSI